MNAYFFKMNKEEKDNILDQHKSIYDGFKTNYGMNKEQPLYVQDYANDKGGITVNNQGNVDTYKHMNINESDAFTGAKYLPDVSFDFGGPDENMEEYVSIGERKDMIGDGDDDLEHGTFGDDFEDEIIDLEDVLEPMDDEEFSFSDLEIDEELQEPLKEQLDKTLEMFKRFKNYL